MTAQSSWLTNEDRGSSEGQGFKDDNPLSSSFHTIILPSCELVETFPAESIFMSLGQII